MTARRVHLALVVAFLLCLAIPLFGQGSRARIVRLSYVDGDVRIDQGGAQGEQKAIRNMPVVEGTTLKTDDDAHVEVEFENGSTIRLVGPAQVIFRDLSLRDSGNKVTSVDVVNGLAYFDIDRKGDDDFRVSVAGHNLAVRKTSHFRVDGAADGPKVALFKGELELLNAPGAVAVKKGETISFDSSDSAHYYLAKEVDPLGPDVWDHDRAEERDTYARSEAYRNSLSYAGSPYSYGMYDMSSYGGWFSGPGGPCWRPWGYGMSWDPFSSGAWSYYPGAGWVFVSSYPWGWTPYRYGAWNYYGSTGWCWSPGGYYGWNPVPVIVAQPPAYVAPTPPTKPGGPPVFIGGRKILPGQGDNPGAGGFRKPAKGFDHDGPDRTPSPAAGIGGGGMPTAKPLTPIPSGGRWGDDGGSRGMHGRGTPSPKLPANPTSNPSPSPSPAPAPSPRPEARPVTPAPMPHVDSSPRVAPAPAPAPAPHVDSPKGTSPHGMGFAGSAHAPSMHMGSMHVSSMHIGH